jgi:hypothetical protein
MKYPAWRTLGGGVLCALAVGLVWGSCRTGRDDRLPVEQNDPEWTYDAELRRMDQLESRRKLLFWSLTTRCAVADRLIAGRLTLFEAAAAFRAIDEVKRRGLKLYPGDFAGKTDEERLCRRVIHFTFERLCGSPERGKVVDRLEEELQKHLRRHGTVQLPEFRRPENMRWFDE